MDALLELAQADRRVLRRRTARFEVAAAPDELVAATSTALNSVGSMTARWSVTRFRLSTAGSTSGTISCGSRLSGALCGWSNFRRPAVVFLIASWFRPVIRPASAALATLQRLDLLICRQVTDAGLKELKSLKGLESLDLHDCKKVTGAGLKDLREVKGLRRLDLRNCEKIRDAAADLQKDLPQLRITLRRPRQLEHQQQGAPRNGQPEIPPVAGATSAGDTPRGH